MVSGRYMQKDIDRLESIQRRDAGFVPDNNGQKRSVQDIMQNLNWKLLIEGRLYHPLALLQKLFFE